MREENDLTDLVNLQGKADDEEERGRKGYLRNDDSGGGVKS